MAFLIADVAVKNAMIKITHLGMVTVLLKRVKENRYRPLKTNLGEPFRPLNASVGKPLLGRGPFATNGRDDSALGFELLHSGIHFFAVETAKFGNFTCV